MKKGLHDGIEDDIEEENNGYHMARELIGKGADDEESVDLLVKQKMNPPKSRRWRTIFMGVAMSIALPV
jgi:hypothetical protein